MTTTINADTTNGVKITSDTSGVLGLQTNGNTAVTIDGSQNVGIGTTTPDIFSRGYGRTVGINDSGSSGAVLQINSASSYSALELGRGGVRKAFFTAQSTVTELGNLEAVPLAFYTNSAERARIDSSGNFFVSTGYISATNTSNTTVASASFDSTTSWSLKVANASTTAGTGAGIYFLGGTNSESWIGNLYESSGVGALSFQTRVSGVRAERMRIDSSGNMLLGATSGAGKLYIESTNPSHIVLRNPSAASYTSLRLYNDINSGVRALEIDYYGSTYSGGERAEIFCTGAYPLLFGTSNTERARIDSAGNAFFSGNYSVLYPGSGNTTTGIFLESAGQFCASRDNTVVGRFNRNSTDGTLISFARQGTEIGTISVSGGVVTYGSFAGSHWSQLSDGSKPDILRGTVLDSINELVQWPNEPTTERLCKVKVSDTAGSKKVYGVFMDWDNDWTATNDMYVTAVGAFICRVNASVTVQEGDLLESNGDGTARVQADDLIRSSTIGKVTCTEKTHQYDDGSYCVPTVLYCG